MRVFAVTRLSSAFAWSAQFFVPYRNLLAFIWRILAALVSGIRKSPMEPNSAAIIRVIQAVHLHPRCDCVMKPPIYEEYRISSSRITEEEGDLGASKLYSIVRVNTHNWACNRPTKRRSSKNAYSVCSLNGAPNICQCTAYHSKGRGCSKAPKESAQHDCLRILSNSHRYLKDSKSQISNQKRHSSAEHLGGWSKENGTKNKPLADS